MPEGHKLETIKLWNARLSAALPHSREWVVRFCEVLALAAVFRYGAVKSGSPALNSLAFILFLVLASYIGDIWHRLALIWVPSDVARWWSVVRLFVGLAVALAGAYLAIEALLAAVSTLADSTATMP
jgi:hypothetical protein